MIFDETMRFESAKNSKNALSSTLWYGMVIQLNVEQ